MRYASPLAVLLMACLQPVHAESTQFDHYLFAYFTGNDSTQEQISFATSADGTHFTRLGNDPVIDASHTEMGGLRDPYIFRGKDGQFYMTATDMDANKKPEYWDSNRGIVLMKSPDLVHWQSARINIENKYGSQFPQTKHAWAPEIAYDPLTDSQMVYFSLKYNGSGSVPGLKDNMMYYSHINSDFTDFTETPRRRYPDDAAVYSIDSDIAEKDGQYYLMMLGSGGSKDGIRLVTSDHLTWGYAAPSNNLVQQTNLYAEGVEIYKLNDRNEYIVMYDLANNGDFQLTRTTDFKHFEIVRDTDITQLGPRHGSVISLTAEEYQNLLKNQGKITVTDAASAPDAEALRPFKVAPGAGIDSGTLKADGSMAAEIWGLSADGTVAVGDSYSDAGDSMRAAVWSGTPLAPPRELATLGSGREAAAKAYSVAGDGRVIGGFSDDADGNRHATIWSADHWSVMTDLGTLTSDHSGTSSLRALSGEGAVAAGESSVDGGTTHAALWYGPKWSQKKDLGTLRADNSGMSEAYALSADGRVAGGYSATEDRVDSASHAALWSGSDWSQKKDLGTLRSDNRGASLVRALAADGSVAAGQSQVDSGYTHAAVWSGPQWSHKRDLGTLRPDNSGSSWVRAISADGKTLGGAASSRLGSAHGTIWTGKNLATKIDLGTLSSSSAAVSEVQALSADGRIAAGYSETDSGAYHAALWRVSERSVQGAIDVANTGQSVELLARQTFDVVAQQLESLDALHRSCAAGSGKFCWSFDTGHASEKDDGNVDRLDALLGFGLGDQLTVGAAVNYSRENHSSAPSFAHSPNYWGVGVFTDWRWPFAGGQWFVHPSLAVSHYETDIRRPLLAFTEAGGGHPDSTGFSADLALGQTYFLSGGIHAGWHAGMTHGHVRRDGYTETDADFPIRYDRLSYGETFAYGGLDLAIPLQSRLQWFSSAELKRSVGATDIGLNAHADYLGDFHDRDDLRRTRGELETGLKYALGDALAASTSAAIGHNAFGDREVTVWLRLSGSF